MVSKPVQMKHYVGKCGHDSIEGSCEKQFVTTYTQSFRILLKSLTDNYLINPIYLLWRIQEYPGRDGQLP